jgi:hypothetical protein
VKPPSPDQTRRSTRSNSMPIPGIIVSQLPISDPPVSRSQMEDPNFSDRIPNSQEDGATTRQPHEDAVTAAAALLNLRSQDYKDGNQRAQSDAD